MFPCAFGAKAWETGEVFIWIVMDDVCNRDLSATAGIHPLELLGMLLKVVIGPCNCCTCAVCHIAIVTSLCPGGRPRWVWRICMRKNWCTAEFVPLHSWFVKERQDYVFCMAMAALRRVLCTDDGGWKSDAARSFHKLEQTGHVCIGVQLGPWDSIACTLLTALNRYSSR